LAWAWCKEIVEARYLKSPATAEWPGGGFFPEYTYKDFVTDVGGGKYRIGAWVDSQNAFGAIIRTHFSCVMTNRGGGRWELSDFFEVSPTSGLSKQEVDAMKGRMDEGRAVVDEMVKKYRSNKQQ